MSRPNPASFQRAAGYQLPTPAAAPPGTEFPFPADYGHEAAEDATEVAPDTHFVPDPDPTPPARPVHQIPREVNLTTGRVTGSGTYSIGANAIVLVGMPAPGQPQAIGLSLQAAAVGLEIVPADSVTAPGFPIPTASPPLTINAAQCYVHNTTGAPIVLAFLSVGHNS